ncbi:hypothetical protein SeMB42_g07086 [Synchytrium endobioticum]|uniref:Cyclic nucleotide-binding domain-containing protein n=1 Tax=Synchytrium endobioticum TaxID=286115 RepID=A0A507CDA3_9FUNG|nr:hypothetical protein SeMB42_g07086 [Synchytrium endobioticum]TPX39037.1 hypothetical protein SeLEV6574_g07450 [Synchytrium endobioticum]
MGQKDGLPPSMAENWLEFALKFYVLPGGRFLAIWDGFIVFVAVLNTFMLTFMAAFQLHTPGAWVLCYLIDVIFIADIYIKFHRAFLSNGFWVVFPKDMALRYLVSVEFWIDALSSFPFDIFVLSFIGVSTGLPVIQYLALVRLPKLIRIRCVVTYFMREEQKLHSGFMLQLVKFITYMITILHCVACVWFAMACGGQGDSGPICSLNSWVSSRTFDATNETLFGLYVDSIYWATTTLTTTGYGDIHPDNTGERVMALIVMIIGILFFGYISGTIASSLSNMDSRRVTYRQKMDAVVEYMRTRDMEDDLKGRVLDYFDYAWNRNKGIDVRHLFDEMPATFRGDLMYTLNVKIIDQVKVFSQCSIGFRRTVAYTIKFYLYTAEESLAHAGDLAQEMYFITQGRIDVFDGADKDQKRALKCLIEGGAFGYAATILGGFHEYSAKAICNSDVFVLTRDEIEGIFRAYPEDAKIVRLACEREQHQTTLQSRKLKPARSEDSDRDLLSESPHVLGGDKYSKVHGSQGFLIMDSPAPIQETSAVSKRRSITKRGLLGRIETQDTSDGSKGDVRSSQHPSPTILNTKPYMSSMDGSDKKSLSLTRRASVGRTAPLHGSSSVANATDGVRASTTSALAADAATSAINNNEVKISIPPEVNTVSVLSNGHLQQYGLLPPTLEDDEATRSKASLPASTAGDSSSERASAADI